MFADAGKLQPPVQSLRTAFNVKAAGQHSKFASTLNTFPIGDDASRRGWKTPFPAESQAKTNLLESHSFLTAGGSLGIGGNGARCPCVGIIDPEQLLQ